MNDISMYGGRCGELPEPIISIYLAFDAGEFCADGRLPRYDTRVNTRGLKLREFFRVKMPPNDALQRSPTTLRFSGRTRRTAHRTPGPERRIGRRDSSLILVEIFNAYVMPSCVIFESHGGVWPFESDGAALIS